jgi:hypothetical protein
MINLPYKIIFKKGLHMSEEVFRPRKPEENLEKLQSAEAIRQAASGETTKPSGQMPFEIKGNVPPEFLNAMGMQSNPAAVSSVADRTAPSGNLKDLLDDLRQSTSVYEKIELPSRGIFYDGENGPSDGVLHIKPMTGEEEQILATPRFVKKGQALNMIFSRCIKEKIKPEDLLTVDRTYLLIYLRGISYSPLYEVEIKCPECERKFSTEIDLNTLMVESAPEGYGPSLEGVLPTSKYSFRYRLSKGKDETDIQDHRERRIKNFGDNSTDDTLIYRTSVLVEEIQGITDKRDLQTLIKNLPISDVSHIRNCVNEPPFGVDTKVDIVCPSCLQEFDVDLPLEANFFFPRRRRDKMQA